MSVDVLTKKCVWLARLPISQVETKSIKLSIGVPTREKNSKTVTDADAAEMGWVLQDMKSLALGIQEEQDRQLQQLDLLSDSVDKANERIRTDVRQVNKLT